MAWSPESPADTRALHANDRVAVLMNPAARAAGDKTAIATAVRALEERYRVDVIAPSRIDELDASARAAAASSNAVIVAGGDGTLHRVINAIDGMSVPVGLLPLGTGNDFARALRLPPASAGAARRILDGQIRQIDLVAVNSRLFCTVGVLGLPAQATLGFNRLLRPGSWTRPMMRSLGTWSYRIAGLHALLSRGSRMERVAIETAGPGFTTHVQRENGSSHTGRTACSGVIGDAEFQWIHGAFVTNTTQLGGGMNVPVGSDMADGQFEIACIKAMPRARLLWAFTCLAHGWRVPDGVLHIARTSRAIITCSRRLPFAADGELVCEESRFDISVRPGALQVIC